MYRHAKLCQYPMSSWNISSVVYELRGQPSCDTAKLSCLPTVVHLTVQTLLWSQRVLRRKMSCWSPMHLGNEDLPARTSPRFVVSRLTVLPLGAGGGLRYLTVALPGDQFMGRLMTKPTKWHVRPVFAVRKKKAWVLIYALSAQRRLWSDRADAQADLSLRWAHSHFVGFVMRRFLVFLYN